MDKEFCLIAQRSKKKLYLQAVLKHIQDAYIRNKKDRTALDIGEWIFFISKLKYHVFIILIAIKKKREEIVKIFKMKGIHEQGIREDLNDLEELDDLEDKIINFKL